MAELLFKYYPKLVNVLHYLPCSSIAKKIDNWCTLNKKVLEKIDVKLSKDLIYQIAQSKQGVIEKLLFDIRKRILNNSTMSQKSINKFQDKFNNGL